MSRVSRSVACPLIAPYHSSLLPCCTCHCQEASWDIDAYGGYVASLVQHDMQLAVPVHAMAAFDLEAANHKELYRGLLDWQHFLSPHNAVLRHLAALPMSWGALHGLGIQGWYSSVHSSVGAGAKES